MSEKLSKLKAVAEETVPAVKLEKIKISNYRFFHGTHEFEFKSKNVLMYGENGSGKSTIYKALELLTKSDIKKELIENKCVFCGDEEVEIEYFFNNNKSFPLSVDNFEILDEMSFASKITVYKPLLDYKKLLKIHYSEKSQAESINVFGLMEYLLADYPVGKGTLKDLMTGDPDVYFNTLKDVLSNHIIENVRNFLSIFTKELELKEFKFSKKMTEDRKTETLINMDLFFRTEHNITEKYHLFLNESKLTALAISVYFAVIKKMSALIDENSLKILVLDDLLIGLDMDNRLKLLDLLKNHFEEFQIFFFTHDKELFEIYKGKMDWEKFELFLDDSGDFPSAIVKKGGSNIEKAKKFYSDKNYECCGLFLRKEFEKTLKSFIPPEEQLDKNCKELDLSGMIDKAIQKAEGDAKTILQKLHNDRKHLLNPLSHLDLRNIYSGELLSAMVDMEKLSLMIKGSYKGNENFYQWPDFSDERIKNEMISFKEFSDPLIKEKIPEYKGGFFTFTAFPDKLSKIYSSSYKIRDLVKPLENGFDRPVFPLTGTVIRTDDLPSEKIWKGTIKSWRSFYSDKDGAYMIEVFENGVILLKNTYNLINESGKWISDSQIRRECKYFMQFVEKLYVDKLEGDDFVNIKVEMSDTFERKIHKGSDRDRRNSFNSACEIEEIEAKKIYKFKELKDPEKSSYILRKKIFEFFQWSHGADWDTRDDY
ncbi:MAG TPA: ATP-binding protein [bacterium]|nr:ATP-binding protein [bacterium]